MINFRKYLPYLLFSCKRVTVIISKDVSDRSFKEKVILYYHAVICKACVNYNHQNELINLELKNVLKVDGNNRLSESKKKEIINKLNEEV